MDAIRPNKVENQINIVTVLLFELAFDTMIVEYMIHSGISNYTKLAFNSLQIIRNVTPYQPIKQGMIGL